MKPFLQPKVTVEDSQFIITPPVGFIGARREIREILPKAVYDNDRAAFVVDVRPDTYYIMRQMGWKPPYSSMLASIKKHRKKKPLHAITVDTEAGEIQKSGLYKFQEEGVKFLAPRTTAILADDMGLGKTVQIIKTIEVVVPQGRRLVVVPNTLVENWLDEIEMWTPATDDTPIYFIGGGMTKTERIDILRTVYKEPNCWLVMSWEAMRIHATPNGTGHKNVDNNLVRIPFDVVVADEAHRMKNRKAMQSMAIKRIKTPRKYALTGTPVMNRPDELWSMLNWMEPKVFTSYWEFFEDYVDYHEGYFGKEILGAKNLDMLGKLLKARMIRRTKPEVFSQMPPKTYKNIYVPLSVAQKKAYDEVAEYLVTQLESGEIVTAAAVIAKIVRLKQICVSLGLLSKDGITDSGKIDALMELVSDSSSKMVVFSQFARAIGLVHQRLMKAKIPHVVLTGEHSLLFDGESNQKVTRGTVIKEFQKDPKYKLYIGTTQAGGVGITLTAANTVVFLDKMWTPADQVQAEDRLHRIGQKDNVYVVSLLTHGTIEEHIERTLKSKQSLVQDIMSAATGTYQPAAKIEGVEVKLEIVDNRGKLDVRSAVRMLRRDK